MSEVVEFETKQDFNDYYKEHQKEIDELKTKELNNKFKVEGFKIIRNKGKIAFRKIKQQDELTKNPSDTDNSQNDNTNTTFSINQNQKNDDLINILKDLKTKLNNEFDNIIKSTNEQN